MNSFSLDGIDLRELKEPEEQELIKALADFHQEVAGAAEALELRIALVPLRNRPARSPVVHQLRARRAGAMMNARLALARATQIVLRNALGILGIMRPSARSLSHINHTR